MNFLRFFKKQSYNDNIQCLWFCVNGRRLDEKDIKFINKLNEIRGQDKIPIIIVFTKTTDIYEAEEMQKNVNETFGFLPFHKLLAKDFDEETKSFGVEELIYLTLDQCKFAVKGDIFNDIKKNICDALINDFIKENEKLKFKVNEQIAKDFCHDYNKVILDINEFKKYIYYLIEIIINSYIKTTENLYKNNGIDFNSSLLPNFIEEYIEFYKEETRKIVDSIKEKKAINYLNAQVIIEKSKVGNLKIENKCNKNEFIRIIQDNLQNNFYYLAQKFFIYQFIIEFCGHFSEIVNDKMNKSLEEFLKNQEANYFFEEIYKQKIEDLKIIVQKFYANKEYEKNEEPNKGYCHIF